MTDTLEELDARLWRVEDQSSERLRVSLMERLAPARMGEGAIPSDPTVGGSPFDVATIINADVVTAGEIAAGSVHVGHMMGSPANHIPNPGFETFIGTPNTYGQVDANSNLPGWQPSSLPANMAVFNGSTDKRTGTYGLVYKKVLAGDDVYAETIKIPVVAGRKFAVKAWVKGYATNGANTAANVFVRYYDAAGSSLGFVSLSGTVSSTRGASTTWFQLSATGTFPATAVFVGVGVEMLTAGAVGDLLAWDDIELYVIDDDVNHAGGNVIIDANGIAIRNGVLSIEDEFGVSVLTATGYTGTWSDFLQNGLYNGGFESNTAGTPALGRTSDVPFWDLEVVAGSPTREAFVGSVQFVLPAAGDSFRITSDRVRIPEGQSLSVVLVEMSGGLGHINAITRKVELLYYSSETDPTPFVATVANEVMSSSGGLFGANRTPPYFPGVGSKYVAVRITATWQSETSSNPQYTLSDVALRAVVDARGTVFPTGPMDFDRFFRTDLGMEFFWDGARWLSTSLYSEVIPLLLAGISIPLSATTGTGFFEWGLPFPGTTDIYLEDVHCEFIVASGGSALSASHKWVGRVYESNSGTTRATITIDSGSSNAFRSLDVVVDAAIDDGQHFLGVEWTKTGTPGTLRPYVRLLYRRIAT